ncbi:MAG: DUF2304 family protein [bacterium]
MLIQFLLVAFALFALIKVFIKFWRKELPLKAWLIWSVAWCAVVIASILPQTIDRLARTLGIVSGRGADLAVYVAIVILLYLQFRLSVKLDKSEQKITELVRKLALSGYQPPRHE